jgi:hypothetical protein
MYFIGMGIFALLAVLLVVAFLKTRNRESEWEQKEHREGRF